MWHDMKYEKKVWNEMLLKIKHGKKIGMKCDIGWNMERRVDWNVTCNEIWKEVWSEMWHGKKFGVKHCMKHWQKCGMMCDRELNMERSVWENITLGKKFKKKCVMKCYMYWLMETIVKWKYPRNNKQATLPVLHFTMYNCYIYLIRVITFWSFERRHVTHCIIFW